MLPLLFDAFILWSMMYFSSGIVAPPGEVVSPTFAHVFHVGNVKNAIATVEAAREMSATLESPIMYVSQKPCRSPSNVVADAKKLKTFQTDEPQNQA